MDLSFYSTSIHSQMLFISLCKVMYLLFHFLSKELVLTFLNRQVCYQPNPSISIYMITHLFFLHFDNISGYYDNFSGYRILGWCFFFLSTLNISLHSCLACMVSEKFNVILTFPPVQVGSPTLGIFRIISFSLIFYN